MLFTTLIALLVTPSHSQAQDYFVVADPAVSQPASLALDDLRSIFLGHKMFVGSSQRVFGILSRPSTQATERFFEDVLGMPQDQYSAYWRRKLFAGKGHPPKEVGSDEQAVEYVQANRGAIAVVSQRPRQDLLKGLRVLRVNLAGNSLVPVAPTP